MTRRERRRWAPPLSGPCTNPGPSMSESNSVEERAGGGPYPYVELKPAGPPMTISEAGPCPEPEPEPFVRAEVLAALQEAFATLDDEELEVIRLRIVGGNLDDMLLELGYREEDAIAIIRRARKKLADVLFKKPQPK